MSKRIKLSLAAMLCVSVVYFLGYMTSDSIIRNKSITEYERGALDAYYFLIDTISKKLEEREVNDNILIQTMERKRDTISFTLSPKILDNMERDYNFSEPYNHNKK